MQEAQHQRDRQREIDQNAQNPAAAHQPFAARAGKENKRKKAVEQNDDEYQAERGLKNLVDPPTPLFETAKPTSRAIAAVMIWVSTAMESAARARLTPAWAQLSART